jgi:hypothetical protein
LSKGNRPWTIGVPIRPPSGWNGLVFTETRQSDILCKCLNGHFNYFSYQNWNASVCEHNSHILFLFSRPGLDPGDVYPAKTFRDYQNTIARTQHFRLSVMPMVPMTIMPPRSVDEASSRGRNSK